MRFSDYEKDGWQLYDALAQCVRAVIERAVTGRERQPVHAASRVGDPAGEPDRTPEGTAITSASRERRGDAPRLGRRSQGRR